MCSCERMQVFLTVFHAAFFFFFFFLFLFLFDRSGSRYLGWKKLDFILESWNHRKENQSEAEKREKKKQIVRNSHNQEYYKQCRVVFLLFVHRNI